MGFRPCNQELLESIYADGNFGNLKAIQKRVGTIEIHFRMKNKKSRKIAERIAKAIELFPIEKIDPSKLKWVANGIYYGYPQCCIVNFCKNWGKLTDAQKSVHKNSGFIPCPKCSRMILSGKKPLKSLLKNRISNHDFPNER